MELMMSEILDYSGFVGYINENFRKNEETIINGYDAFFSYLRDFSHNYTEQFDPDDEDSINGYAREEFENVCIWFENSSINWISIGARNNWKLGAIGEAVSDLGVASRQIEFQAAIELTESESTWLKKDLNDLGKDDIPYADAVFQKSLQSGDKNLIANAALRRAWSYDHNTEGGHLQSKYWVEAAEKSEVSGSNDAYRWFKRAAEIHSRNMRYSASAELFFRAAISLKRASNSLDDRQLLDFYRMSRKHYELCGESAKAAEMYIFECDAKLKETKFFEKLAFYTYKFLSNYGEAPIKVAFWSSVVILVCAVCYCSLGIYSSSASGVVFSFWSSLYYSVVTFTTLGYGDYYPASGIVKFIAACEALTGLFMTSLFMVTVVRKYSR